MIKKTFQAAAHGVNLAALCGMIGVGAFHYSEAAAQERLATVSEADKECLAQNIFFEARNQSTTGQVAVAWVTINRMEADRYPDTICGVVWQHKQFSWTHDGKSDRIPNNAIAQRAWEDAQLVAEVTLLDWARDRTSPVENATMYHADYVSPYWRTSYERVVTIDDHIFYADNG